MNFIRIYRFAELGLYLDCGSICRFLIQAAAGAVESRLRPRNTHQSKSVWCSAYSQYGYILTIHISAAQKVSSPPRWFQRPTCPYFLLNRPDWLLLPISTLFLASESVITSLGLCPLLVLFLLNRRDVLIRLRGSAPLVSEPIQRQIAAQRLSD